MLIDIVPQVPYLNRSRHFFLFIRKDINFKKKQEPK